MTTLNTTGQSVLGIIATLAWATGRAVHHSTNGYQAARRFHRDQIASGALRQDFFTFVNEAQSGLDLVVEDCDRFLNEWQSFSDDLRAILWIFLGPLLALLWGAACDLAMASARLLGRVWGYWMAQAARDLPAAFLTGRRWVAASVRKFAAALRANVRRWAGQGLEVCDRALQAAFCLA